MGRTHLCNGWCDRISQKLLATTNIHSRHIPSQNQNPPFRSNLSSRCIWKQSKDQEAQHSHIPNKGLGCRQAVDGNMDEEFDHRLDQTRKITARARGAKLTLQESYLMLTTHIVPATTYSLTVTTFTQKQCKQLNIAMDSVLLNKLRINRHMPRAVVYNSLAMGGINFPSFQVTQDQKSILMMLKHLRWNGTVGNDILVVLSAVQLMSGLCESILMDVTTPIEYVAHGWIMHIRNRL